MDISPLAYLSFSVSRALLVFNELSSERFTLLTNQTIKSIIPTIIATMKIRISIIQINPYPPKKPPSYLATLSVQLTP